MTDEELLDASTTELEELTVSGAGIRLEISALEGYQLLGALQLALRHPALGEHVRATVVRVARILEGKFKPYSATSEVIRRGWNPEYDRHV